MNQINNIICEWSAGLSHSNGDLDSSGILSPNNRVYFKSKSVYLIQNYGKKSIQAACKQT